MRKSYLWAGAIAVLIGGWFVSGNLAAVGLKEKADEKPVIDAAKQQKEKLFSVEARIFIAQMRQSSLVVRGRTQVDKQVSVLSRTTGIVEQADYKEGDKVSVGDLLCRLDIRDRKARLAQAKAQMASTARNYEAARKLFKRKFGSAAKLASERALHDAARAVVEQIELEIGFTNIKAPIDGIITSFQGEQGEFLQAGKPCAVVSVFDPILVVIQVGEREIEKVVIGQKAKARLVTGTKVAGTVSHISPTADVATRTFKVEISIGNPGNKLRDGITAEVTLPLAPVKSHLIPAGIIGLDDDGRVGVRTIINGNKVKFMPIKIVGQAREGTWVQGLPDNATLITAGQDYVLTGQTVEVVFRAQPSS